MQVIKISPRGYCYGVVDAINLAKKAAQDPHVPKPVHILGAIVHNRHAVASLADYGIISLDGPDREALLDQVKEGTVIFTAHGVSPKVKRKALDRGLYCIDATCPDVTRTHALVRELAARGYTILYIGKRGHPEPEGVIGEAPERVHLIESEADVDRLDIGEGPVAVTTQTTLSIWDTQRVIDCIRRRFPHAEIYNDLCLATQQRQEAAVEQGREADLVLVVGDRRSNNSNRLVQVVQEIAGRPARLIDSAADIDPRWLSGVRRVAVTAGSSTPSEITREVVRYLENQDVDVLAPRA
ncbi:MAG: 4-hydroxy-3-methylbut-2-enyl diphosphate reductase [Firmicutes bacterium]|nr:4-hydroxy-3-methylbut-2-enyl diphosphate reductase [Bacillota bacterium]